jgi:hypothetical protein
MLCFHKDLKMNIHYHLFIFLSKKDRSGLCLGNELTVCKNNLALLSNTASYKVFSRLIKINLIRDYFRYSLQ